MFEKIEQKYLSKYNLCIELATISVKNAESRLDKNWCKKSYELKPLDKKTIAISAVGASD